jgi:hypothetical protein
LNLDDFPGTLRSLCQLIGVSQSSDQIVSGWQIANGAEKLGKREDDPAFKVLVRVPSFFENIEFDVLKPE